MTNQVGEAPLPAAFQRGLVTRRSLLGVGAAGLLAACTGKSGRPKPTADRSAREAIVNWSNWPDYIDVSNDGLSHPTLTEFTATSGITVHYTEDYYDNCLLYTSPSPRNGLLAR